MKNTFLITTLLLFASITLVGCSGKDTTQKASSFVERSLAYERQGQYRAAMIEARNAIQAEPSNHHHYLHYATLLIDIGTPNQAEELLSPLKENNEVKLLLAHSLILQRKYVSAKDILNSWEFSSTNQIEFEYLSALQEFLSGDTKTALKQLGVLSQDSETKLSIHIDYISLLIQTENIKNAELLSTELLIKHPTNPELLYYKALIEYKNNSVSSAEKTLTEALYNLKETDILLNNKNQVLELLSSVLTELGRHSEALVYSKIIRDANPEAYTAKQQYKSAISAASNGDIASAKAAFEDILNQYPNNQQAALLLGLIHLEEGDLASGEALLSNNINAETAPINIIQATTLAQAKQGKSEEALDVLQRALLARPDDTTLLGLYGVISLNNGYDSQGLKSISKALELEPSRTRLHLFLAQYYVSKSNSDLALGHLRKAYAQNIKDWPTTEYFTSLLIKNGDTSEAVKVRNNLNTHFTNEPSARLLVAMIDFQLGNTEAAKVGLETLHIDNPNDLQVIGTLGRMYLRENEFDKSASMWIKALSQQPNNKDFLNSAVRSKARSVPLNDLIRWLSEQSKLNPEIGLPLKAAMSELFMKSKDYESALQLTKGITFDQSQSSTLIRFNATWAESIQLAKNKELTTALAKALEARKQNPKHLGLFVYITSIGLESGDFESVNEAISFAEAQHGPVPTVINAKAKLLLANDKTEEALELLTSTWNNAPAKEISQLYISLVSTHRPSDMSDVLVEFLEITPNDVKALYALAGLRLKDKKDDEAIALYKEVVKIETDHVPALNNLAWLLRESDIEGALEFAETAAGLAPTSAPVLDTYAWLLYLNGDLSKAEELIDRALDIEPDSSEIQAHKKEISS